jgi:hypothetical protein
LTLRAAKLSFRAGLTPLASALLALLAACGPGNTANHQPKVNAPPHPEGTGFKYQRVPLENLPEKDPLYLAPRHGENLTNSSFWVVWETPDVSKTRLICSRDGQLWYDMGLFISWGQGERVEFAPFSGNVRFCVEYDEDGKRWRSPPRQVSLAPGARFASSERSIEVKRGKAMTFEVGLAGEAVDRLTVDDVIWRAVPESTTLGLGVVGHAGEHTGPNVRLSLDGATLEKPMTVFLTLRDRASGGKTDRMKLTLVPVD